METVDDINGWIRNAREEIRYYQALKEKYEGQIEMLEPVYRDLGRMKQEFREARKRTEQIFEMKVAWRGVKCKSFCNAGATLDNSCGSYYNRLDEVHDAINRKIGELKAAKRELLPIIGTLLGNIEQWKVDLENLRN